LAADGDQAVTYVGFGVKPNGKGNSDMAARCVW
jgi:hypothetical protein